MGVGVTETMHCPFEHVWPLVQQTEPQQKEPESQHAPEQHVADAEQHHVLPAAEQQVPQLGQNKSGLSGKQKLVPFGRHCLLLSVSSCWTMP